MPTGIVISGGGGITNITATDLATAISGSTLTPGTLYRITDLGGVVVLAISANRGPS